MSEAKPSEPMPVPVPALLLVALMSSAAFAQQPHPVAPDPQFADSDSEADSDAEADSEAEAEAEADSDADADAEADSEAEADADADSDADPLADLEPEEDPLPDANRPRLSVEVSPRDEIMTGDLFTLKLRADALKVDDIAVPRDQDFAPFDVLDRRARVEEGNERAVHFFELDLLALEPGDHTLGPVRIRVVTADGVVGEVETDTISIRVGSVLGNEPDAEPRPPTEPVQVYEDDYTLAWIAGILGLILLTALITLLLARWWRRRQKEAAPPPPPRPPWEIALEKLEVLRRDRTAAVEEERIVGWVDGVSDAVREYLGHRYVFDGLESTTDEIVAELQERKMVGVSKEEVAAFLGDCDLIKFAKATFDGEQCDELLAAGIRIVRTTMHRPAPPPDQNPIPATMPPTEPVVVPMPAQAAPAPSHPDARWMPKDEAPPAQPNAEPADAPPAQTQTEPQAAAAQPVPHAHPAARPIPETIPPKKIPGLDTLPDGTRFDQISSAPSEPKPDTLIEPAPTLPAGEPPEGGSA